jgi:hypothetical protein
MRKCARESTASNSPSIPLSRYSKDLSRIECCNTPSDPSTLSKPADFSQFLKASECRQFKEKTEDIISPLFSKETALKVKLFSDGNNCCIFLGGRAST